MADILNPVVTEEPKGYLSREELIDRLRKYHPDDKNEDLVRRAYDFAEAAHAGQRRKSGEPYFSHPVAVAVILIDMMLDGTTIAAALLHDCVEDVDGCTRDIVREQFGSEVELLVDGVTKLNRLNFASREQAQAETLRKMLIAMAKDIRVVLIKLADRLHNMRTLRWQSPERQQPIARETLDIYAPLAHRMGVYTVKWELEDLSLRYLDPTAYYDLVQRIGMTREDREQLIAEVSGILREKLRERGIQCEIEGRPKHFYSIYRKMKNQNKTLEEITDLIAIRVLVNTVTDCYNVLGIVHNIWPLVPGRFKDYIAMPKQNNYQSLHTTVVHQGHPFEVQMRTFEMHRNAEYGIAAHWRYKEGKASADDLDEKLAWLRRIIEWQGDTRDPEEFGELLRVDLFADEVFVFTPRGDVYNMPRGATPLDFAYRIHSHVGNTCIGAKVNGRIVTFDTPLETGDTVEVMTSPAAHGPSRDWLKIVKTGEAKAKIRAWLKKEERPENIPAGHEALEREVKKQGYTLSKLLTGDLVELITRRYSALTLDDLYASIGFGSVSAPQVANRLIDEYRKAHKDELPPPDEKIVEELVKKTAKPKPVSQNGVLIDGEAGMQVRMAKCCNPLPGDDIVGYVTHFRGVTVHRRDCASMNTPDVEKDRLIRAEWAGNGATGESYDAQLRVITYNRTGMFAEIGVVLAEKNISVVSFTGNPGKDNLFIFHVTITVKSTSELNTIIRELRKHQDIMEVERVRA